MPFNGSISNIASRKDWSALAQLLRDLQSQINAAATADKLSYATIDRGGITVTNGGSVTVKDTDGHTVAISGALPVAFNRADGSRQPGFVLYREDGTTAVMLADINATTPPYKQAWQVFDRAGNTVMSDDTDGGVGLATPYIPHTTPVNTNTATWPATTATSWTEIAACYLQRQNPGMMYAIQTVADSGTTGTVRIAIDGTTVATSPTVTSSFAVWSAIYYWPAGWTFNSTATFSLQAERLSGTGSVYAAVYQLTGVQS